MGEAVIKGGKPFPGTRFIKVTDDMDIAPESGEELSRRNVPVPIAPGAVPPAGEVIEYLGIFGIIEAIVLDPGRDEAGVAFLSFLRRG